jgi:hypothetical protein
MIVVILQFIFTAAACLGLWRLWLTFAGRGKVTLIVAAGFLIRALGSQALFWISWLHLPIARSLQFGDGFWFFAPDASKYLSYATELIGYGPRNILSITSTYPSHLYVQFFAIFAATFGVVASVGILFNCLAYLLTCAIIVWLGSRSSRAEWPLLVALAAVSFGPGMILWSLQPLKDTFFLMLITALVGACFFWQQLWREGAPLKWRRVLGCAAAVLFLIYEIAGIRWYFSAIVWCTSLVFFVLVALQSRMRWRALLAGAVLFVLISQAFRLGGDGDIPRQILRYLEPRSSIAARLRPSWLTAYVADSRRGFEQTPGATMIAPGPTLTPPPQQQKEKQLVVVPPSPAPAVAEVAQSKRDYRQTPVVPPSPAPAVAQSQRPSLQTPAATTSSAVPALSTPPPQENAQPAVVSPTVGQALVAGFTAMFIPKTLAQALGLVRIGGGRGFWYFVDIDTLVFDAVVLFAFVYCLRALRSHARVTPLFILLLLVCLLAVGPMMYTVTNFGTLFRLRVMIYLIVALLPLTLEPRTRYLSS